MKTLNILLFIVVIFNFPFTQNAWHTLANSPWPMIKHDPQFTGHSPYRGPQKATVIWAKDLPDGIFSGPVIGEDNNLFFGSYYQLDSSDHFYSYNPEGSLLWKYKLGTNWPPQSGVLIDSSNTIYFGALDKYFYALNANGTLKWKYETSASIVELAIPNIDKQGRLYITNSIGELYSLNPDGTLNWKVKYNEGFFERSPVFSPDGNTIYICGSDSNLYALNLDNSIKWTYSCGKIFKGTAVDSLGYIFFSAKEKPHYFYSLKPNGQLNWKYLHQNVGPTNTQAIPTFDNKGNVYFMGIDTTTTDYYRALVSLKKENADFNWLYVFKDSRYDDFFQPLISDIDGTIYTGSTLGNYYYAISRFGNLKWKLALNDYQVDNTGAIADHGTLYLGVHRSSLFANQKNTLIAIRDTNVTAISEEEINHFSFKLNQNYPNPFNPMTKISFSIPENSNVLLKVYDILGKEIKTLVNGFIFRGEYFEIFDGSELSSGIYIYKLNAGKYSSTKKMVMIK
jgi:Secretion system C-terminal sorting domain/PQQ-like domain